MGHAMQSAVEEMSMFLLEWQLLIHTISSLTALSFAMPFVTSAIYFVCVSEIQMSCYISVILLYSSQHFIVDYPTQLCY